MNTKSILDKCKVWFFSTAEEDILHEEIEERDFDSYSNLITRGEEPFEMADEDHEFIRGEVKNNRRMINEVRVRVSRIDERTSFIAKLIFGMFIGIIVSVGGGLILAWVMM